MSPHLALSIIPQKWGNVEVGRIVPHAPRPRAKRTLNVLYRLTTEMGEGRGWENSTGKKNAIKLIYCPGGGRDLDNVGNQSLFSITARDGVTGLLY